MLGKQGRADAMAAAEDRDLGASCQGSPALAIRGCGRPRTAWRSPDPRLRWCCKACAKKAELITADVDEGSGLIHAEWERASEVPWHQVRGRLAELAHVPSDNVITDNLRRLEAGLPMVKRGRWGR